MHMQICLHTQYTHVQKKKDDLSLQMAEHRATGDRRVSRAFLTAGPRETGGYRELFWSVAVVITASESLRDIANFGENGTLISTGTRRLGTPMNTSTYHGIKPQIVSALGDIIIRRVFLRIKMENVNASSSEGFLETKWGNKITGDELLVELSSEVEGFT